MRKNGFTVSELTIAISLSGLLFLTMGFLWYFMWQSFVSNDREAVLYEEIMSISSQIEKDMSFIAFGSKVRSSAGGAISASGGNSFSLPLDTDGDYLPDSTVQYSLSSGQLFRGSVVVSDKVTDMKAFFYPSGAAMGDSFTLRIDLTVTYDPSGASGTIGTPINPQETITIIFPAKQVSVG